MMRYAVDKTCVTHDRLEDEVIIINVATGSYYFRIGTGGGRLEPDHAGGFRG